MSAPAINQDFTDVSSGKLAQAFYIFILAFIQFSFITDYLVLLPLGPELIKTFQINPNHYSYLISGYTMSAAISGFFSSFIVDKIERKKALLVCFSLFSVGAILCAYSVNFYMLLFARIYTGAFGGVLGSLIIIYLGDLLPVKLLGRATGTVMIANSLGSVVAVPGSIFLVQTFGWKFPFWILFIMNLLVLLLATVFLPQLKKDFKSNTKDTKKVFAAITNPKYFWPLVFMSMLAFAGGATILPFLSTFVVTNLGFTTENLSMVFFFGGLASMVMGPLAGMMIDRFGKQNVFLLLNFFSIIPLILLTIYPLEDSVTVALMVTTMFFCFSTARHVSGMTLINSLFPKEIRGRFISMNGSIQLMAGSIATIVSGNILYTEDNLLMNFDIIGIIGISATIICIFTAFIIEE
ncbi:MAG: MFS transporter [Cytophagaceae bacterium]